MKTEAPPRPVHWIDGVPYTLVLDKDTGATVLAPTVPPRPKPAATRRCRDCGDTLPGLRENLCRLCSDWRYRS